MMSKRKGAVLTLVALLGLVIAGSAGAGPPADEPTGEESVNVASTVSPLLHYQGRLTDPTTNEPVSDGSRTISFRLYDDEMASSLLWTETKDVPVKDGLFSVVLGDTTPLDASLFNGQALWLGIKVGTDPEATPRQSVLPVAYAMSLVPGATIATDSSGPALQVHNTGSGDALQLGGSMSLDDDLTVGGNLIGGSHTHSGGAITSGTVSEAHIAAAIARDSEVSAAVEGHAGDPDAHHTRYTDGEAWAAALANDGPGSGLDADRLDGQEANAFASANHTHWGELWEGSDPGLSLGSETVGLSSAGGEVGVYGESESGTAGHFYSPSGMALLASGNAEVTKDLVVGGRVQATSITYASPRTHTYVVGSEAFLPDRDVDYRNGSGCGGAYINASVSGRMQAPVHLPQGAQVTRFEVFFYDTSSRNVSVDLDRQALRSCGYAGSMAEVTSSGTSGYYSLVDSTILGGPIDNTTYSYFVDAWADPWDGSSLKVKGAVITYQITEAP